MYINESLANGLKERLWNECNDIVLRAPHLVSQYEKTHKIKWGSRTVIIKLEKLLQSGFKEFLLASSKSKSRSNPVVLFAILDKNSEEKENNWVEKMFLINNLSINAWGELEHYRPVVRIGEHAVSRVFQRHPEIYNPDSGDFEIFKILPEFQSLALLGQPMYMLFMLLTAGDEHALSLEQISIPFVSKNGMFLGKLNLELGTCDVRTFITDHQMSPVQNELAKQVRTLLEDKQFEKLAFVFQQIEKDDMSGMEDFCFNLYPVVNQFAELVTWNENNLTNKQEVKNIFLIFLKGLARILIHKWEKEYTKWFRSRLGVSLMKNPVRFRGSFWLSRNRL